MTHKTQREKAKAEREERLAKRLRENLRRRKAVVRKHKDSSDKSDNASILPQESP